MSQTLNRRPAETPSDSGTPVFAQREISLPGWGVLENAPSALLNILEDLTTEKSSLENQQRAMLNIFEDFDTEKAGMEGAQRAVLNILDDFALEKTQFQATQRSVLNILEDMSQEKTQLQETQRAALNILEDFDAEKLKVELANRQLEKEIEERKRAEQGLQRVNAELIAANKELEAFSYSVSHDLRAPLRGIDGFSLALLEDYRDNLDESGKDYLQRVRAAAQRMGVLIDDLLNLSRVARAEMRRERVDLSGLATSVAQELKKSEPERAAGFFIAPNLEAEGDLPLLRIVLENLLRNAWKFTSKHSRARIEVGRTHSNGAPAFFVRDDGAGFDVAYADRLFGAFQRLHSTSEFPGTGVGLATVQRIIHRHGGRIWAEGAVEQGATFFFTLEP